MNNQFEKPYQPSTEEVKKAEEMMTGEQVSETNESFFLRGIWSLVNILSENVGLLSEKDKSSIKEIFADFETKNLLDIRKSLSLGNYKNDSTYIPHIHGDLGMPFLETVMEDELAKRGL